MLNRIAIVAAILFCAVAIGAVFIPSNPEGVKCGNLVSPDWTNDQTEEMISEASDLYDRSAGSTIFGEYAGQAVGMAANARRNNRDCEDARGTRKIVAGSAAGLAVATPLALFFIGGARREDDAT